jgi:hypothetical protein
MNGGELSPMTLTMIVTTRMISAAIAQPSLTRAK